MPASVRGLVLLVPPPCQAKLLPDNQAPSPLIQHKNEQNG